MAQSIPASFEPAPSASNDYMFAELEEKQSHSQFTMTHSDQSKYYVPLSPDTEGVDDVQSEEEDEEDEEDAEISNEYGSLDVIAVKQFHQSNMDFTSQLYVGSLTVLGLYVLYRYLRK